MVFAIIYITTIELILIYIAMNVDFLVGAVVVAPFIFMIVRTLVLRGKKLLD